EALYQSQAIAETDYESAKLAYATAASAAATAEANLQTAKDAMEDTQVRAPITGTVLELDAVLHTVISSPNLGGGTVILKMANLDAVQDSTLVNETDVGKLQPGMPATVTVDAYPDRQFDGRVVKIKPQAVPGRFDRPADQKRLAQELHRVRAAGRQAGAGPDQDGAHRPGLYRGDERPDRKGHRPRAAECVARTVAAAIQAALPERD